MADSHRRPVTDTMSPAPTPSTASSVLSMSSCRRRRPRVAPIDERMAISRPRTAPRISRRFATFAQATRSTRAPAVMNDSHVGSVTFPLICSLIGMTLADMPRLDSGNSRAQTALNASISARA